MVNLPSRSMLNILGGEEGLETQVGDSKLESILRSLKGHYISLMLKPVESLDCEYFSGRLVEVSDDLLVLEVPKPFRKNKVYVFRKLWMLLSIADHGFKPPPFFPCMRGKKRFRREIYARRSSR